MLRYNSDTIIIILPRDQRTRTLRAEQYKQAVRISLILHTLTSEWFWFLNSVNIPFINTTTFLCWITITWDIAITIWQYINSRKLINTETVIAISKGSVLKMFAIVKTNIKCQSWNPMVNPKYIRAIIGYALNGVWTISWFEILIKISTEILIICSFGLHRYFVQTPLNMHQWNNRVHPRSSLEVNVRQYEHHCQKGPTTYYLFPQNKYLRIYQLPKR